MCKYSSHIKHTVTKKNNERYAAIINDYCAINYIFKRRVATLSQ